MIGRGGNCVKNGYGMEAVNKNILLRGRDDWRYK